MIRNAVVAALIRNSEGRIYLQQRCEGKSYAGKWELPGGKVETGETLEAALIREINEELNVTIKPIRYIATVLGVKYQDSGNSDYGLHFYECELLNESAWKNIVSIVSQHYKWVTREEIDELDLMHNDLQVILQELCVKNGF